MNVTSLNLVKIIELAKTGMLDKDIAEKTGVTKSSVTYHRQCAGFKRKKGMPYHTLYTIYDGKTGAYLYEGTVDQCARFLGVREATIREYRARYAHGIKTRYEVHSTEIQEEL